MGDIVSDLNNAERWLPVAERERREAERNRLRTVRIVGVDIGQSNDYTAISAIESTPLTTTVHGLERMRHIPYVSADPDKPSIVGRVKQLMALPALKDATLIIDRTGVGRPTYDLFIANGLKPIGVSIHGGNTVTYVPGGYNVPKRDLVFSLVALFQGGQMRLPKLVPEAAILAEELRNFTLKINTKAHDSYEAWRDSDHDDLVLACALATWYVAHKYRPRRQTKATMRDQF